VGEPLRSCICTVHAQCTVQYIIIQLQLSKYSTAHSGTVRVRADGKYCTIAVPCTRGSLRAVQSAIPMAQQAAQRGQVRRLMTSAEFSLKAKNSFFRPGTKSDEVLCFGGHTPGLHSVVAGVLGSVANSQFQPVDDAQRPVLGAGFSLAPLPSRQARGLTLNSAQSGEWRQEGRGMM
jgi:hypothetical protein